MNRDKENKLPRSRNFALVNRWRGAGGWVFLYKKRNEESLRKATFPVKSLLEAYNSFYKLIGVSVLKDFLGKSG